MKLEAKKNYNALKLKQGSTKKLKALQSKEDLKLRKSVTSR